MMTATGSEIKKMDDILAMLERCSASEASNMAHEHIQEARTYLLGAMHSEYKMNLGLALEAVAQMPDDHVRSETENALMSLIDNAAI